MNLKQLRDNINAICERIERHPYDNLEDYIVAIPASHVGVVGGQPYVDVKGVNLGFDWDKNKLFLWPDTPIRSTNRDEVQAISAKVNKLSFELRDLRNKINKVQQTQ